MLWLSMFARSFCSIASFRDSRTLRSCSFFLAADVSILFTVHVRFIMSNVTCHNTGFMCYNKSIKYFLV